MMKIFRYALVALCLTLLSSHARSQNLIAYDLTTAAAGTLYTGNQAFGGPVGMAFDVNADGILVTSLGVFDGGRDGFHHVLTTYLYNRDTHALLASERFSGTADATAGTLDGYHRFKELAGGLVLNTGHYVIVASGFANDAGGADLLGNETLAGFVPDTFNNGGGVISTVSPSVYGEASYGGDAYPSSNFGGPLVFNSGTFQYSLFVPEPGSIALFCGLAGLGTSVTFRKARRRLAKKRG
jgi:hypothetical protein